MEQMQKNQIEEKKAFEKLVSYITEHGKTISVGPDSLPCGKEWTFWDLAGNRYAYSAIKVDPKTQQVSMTGEVKKLEAYAYVTGVLGKEELLSYSITNSTTYVPTITTGQTWQTVDIVRAGHANFLKKIN
jgi:hypothetical protein